MSTSDVTPWWKALKIRPEILDASGVIDDVQMSLFRAVYSTGAERPDYARAAYYGEITQPTQQLTDLLAKIAIRLGGGDEQTHAPSLIRLDQGMGGGKSHACIGAWHLAAHPQEFAKTDVGKAVFTYAQTVTGRALAPDLARPHVVVLALDSMTPGATERATDGPGRNLYERFLWRLFGGDYARFESYREHFSSKSKIAEAIKSLGRPVLIIADEIMDYVGNGLDGAADDTLTAQDMAFLRALLDVVNDVPNTFMLAVMIASEKDSLAVSAEAAKRRAELETLMERNGRTRGVHENTDFAAILRRRLFEQEPAREVVEATVQGFARAMADPQWAAKVYEPLSAPWVANFADEVARTYPFHPQLMHYAEKEWANLAGFQKVRSTINVFAAAVYALRQRAEADGWVPLLIGPGDLPLSDTAVRESILDSGLISDPKTQSNYRSLAQNDIVAVTDQGGTARLLDLNRPNAPWSSANPRAAERAATVIFLASIVGARGQGRRGASEAEIKAGTAVPDTDYGHTDADIVVKDLADPDTGLAALEPIPGKGGQQARYYLSTKQTLAMIQRAMRETVTDADKDEAIAQAAERLTVTGPFRKKPFVHAGPKGSTPLETLKAESLDDARTTRLIVLDPAQFTLRNGAEAPTIEAVTAAVGLGRNRLPVEWASSAIFVVANTQQRHHARRMATAYLAAERTLDAPEAQADEQTHDKAQAERNDARRNLDAAVKRMFQHVLFLAQPDPDGERALEEITLDDKAQSALDGTVVWKALVERGKAFDQGQFSARALLHNLRESDYGRPLPEVRDSFWSAPRLPLLHAGEKDLRQALFDAVSANSIRIVLAQDQTVAVTSADEINLNSHGLRLAKPAPPQAEPTTEEARTSSTDEETAATGPDRPGTDTSPPTSASAAEKHLAFTVIQSLINNPDQTSALTQLLRQLYDVTDRDGISYMQATFQIVVNAEFAPALVERANQLGITVSERDQ